MRNLGLSRYFGKKPNKPFPVELPYRLIQLYTFQGEMVLDPFIGSGQTAIAAIKANRHYAGYDINKEYVKLAERRIKHFEYRNLSNHLITGRMKTLYNSKVFVVDFIPPLTSPLFLFPSFAHPI